MEGQDPVKMMPRVAMEVLLKRVISSTPLIPFYKVILDLIFCCTYFKLCAYTIFTSLCVMSDPLSSNARLILKFEFHASQAQEGIFEINSY